MARQKDDTQQDSGFQNISESRLALEEVVDRMLAFMKQEPAAHYQFAIGTDSQVYRGCTKFVTGVIIRRIGKGAWACYRQTVVPRELKSVREKLALETTFSQEVACLFEEEDTIRRMEEVLLPYAYQGAAVESFIDIDAGAVPIINKTALYVQEMVKRVEATGMYAARFKPDSYAASTYADRYTKRPLRLV
ncbi:ribonuclease H-like YkuK family protein [Paenibacillus humicola]|uniref:ribonuclease H-like YkuK family protein n=1 Tax=Paenibacillus humicola TaxID=3110540 RepID=UPI00237AF66C|nr:ribonuclease H-like YkuK family protein [Paenibacillus humicola]